MEFRRKSRARARRRDWEAPKLRTWLHSPDNSKRERERKKRNRWISLKLESILFDSDNMFRKRYPNLSRETSGSKPVPFDSLGASYRNHFLVRTVCSTVGRVVWGILVLCWKNYANFIGKIRKEFSGFIFILVLVDIWPEFGQIMFKVWEDGTHRVDVFWTNLHTWSPFEPCWIFFSWHFFFALINYFSVVIFSLIMMLHNFTHNHHIGWIYGFVSFIIFRYTLNPPRVDQIILLNFITLWIYF